MAKKKSVKKSKRSSKSKTKLKTKKASSLGNRVNIAWKKFTLFLIIFFVSFVFYNVSMNDLFRNFFGILSVILGFLSFAFLIAFIILSLLKSR